MNRTRMNRTTDLGQATTDAIDAADQPSTLAYTRTTMKKTKRMTRMTLLHDPLKHDKPPHHTCQPTSVHSPSQKQSPCHLWPRGRPPSTLCKRQGKGQKSPLHGQHQHSTIQQVRIYSHCQQQAATNNGRQRHDHLWQLIAGPRRASFKKV